MCWSHSKCQCVTCRVTHRLWLLQTQAMRPCLVCCAGPYGLHPPLKWLHSWKGLCVTLETIITAVADCNLNTHPGIHSTAHYPAAPGTHSSLSHHHRCCAPSNCSRISCQEVSGQLNGLASLKGRQAAVGAACTAKGITQRALHSNTESSRSGYSKRPKQHCC
jgi:hypothetical protein